MPNINLSLISSFAFSMAYFDISIPNTSAFGSIFKISKILNRLQVNNKITLALNEFLEFLVKFKKKEKKAIIKDKYFHKFWGIGTFAISLYKK